MGRSGVEFLDRDIPSIALKLHSSGVEPWHTLQKSILFTPLLPNAGPTGGDGLAWPAPTMSLTI
jgi:hypothetical protein